MKVPTSRRAPWHAAIDLDTSQAKSTCPYIEYSLRVRLSEGLCKRTGVSIRFNRYCLPSNICIILNFQLFNFLVEAFT